MSLLLALHRLRTRRVGLTAALACAYCLSPSAAWSVETAKPSQNKSATASSKSGMQTETWAADVARPEDLNAGLESGKGNPWTEGVTPEKQDLAERLFGEANALFLDSRFKEAAQKYRDALAQWDHPAIHYNLALTLINLDDPIDAYRHLRQTFKYRGAPLDPKYQQEALRHLKTTTRQVSELEISCQEPGAKVSLDGNEVMTAPSKVQLVLLPGKHTVSLRKSGYLPREYTLTLVPGEPVTLVARIYDEATLTEKHRPLPFWMPVAVTGVGAALVGTGVILGLESNRKLVQLDDEIKNDPNCAAGCMLSESRSNLQHDGNLYKTWATATIIGGSAAVVGGAVWLWVNRTRVRTYTPEEYERRTSVTPIVGANFVGVTTSGRF